VTKDPGSSSSTSSPAASSSGSEDILVEVRDKMQIIMLNRPEKKNALKVEVMVVPIFCQNKAI
jgi:hypothetical protein